MSGDRIGVADVPETVGPRAAAAPPPPARTDLSRYGEVPLRELRDLVERDYILKKLEEHDWNITRRRRRSASSGRTCTRRSSSTVPPPPPPRSPDRVEEVLALCRLAADPDLALAGVERYVDGAGELPAERDLLEALVLLAGSSRMVPRCSRAPRLLRRVARSPVPRPGAHRGRPAPAGRPRGAPARPGRRRRVPPPPPPRPRAGGDPHRAARPPPRAREEVTGRAVGARDRLPRRGDPLPRPPSARRHGAAAGLGGREPGAGFCAIAMGKLGARELNFSSDVDLIYVYDRDGQTGGRAAVAALRVLREARRAGDRGDREADRGRVRLPGGPEPPARRAERADREQRPRRRALLPVVRPELGAQRPREGRPGAGDLAVGEELLRQLEPFVWRRSLDLAVVTEIQAMKARIDARAGAEGKDDLKLGKGADPRGGVLRLTRSSSSTAAATRAALRERAVLRGARAAPLRGRGSGEGPRRARRRVPLPPPRRAPRADGGRRADAPAPARRRAARSRARWASRREDAFEAALAAHRDRGGRALRRPPRHGRARSAARPRARAARRPRGGARAPRRARGAPRLVDPDRALAAIDAMARPAHAVLAARRSRRRGRPPRRRARHARSGPGALAPRRLRRRAAEPRALLPHARGAPPRRAAPAVALRHLRLPLEALPAPPRAHRHAAPRGPGPAREGRPRFPRRARRAASPPPPPARTQATHPFIHPPPLSPPRTRRSARAPARRAARASRTRRSSASRSTTSRARSTSRAIAAQLSDLAEVCLERCLALAEAEARAKGRAAAGPALRGRDGEARRPRARLPLRPRPHLPLPGRRRRAPRARTRASRSGSCRSCRCRCARGGSTRSTRGSARRATRARSSSAPRASRATTWRPRLWAAGAPPRAARCGASSEERPLRRARHVAGDARLRRVGAGDRAGGVRAPRGSRRARRRDPAHAGADGGGAREGGVPRQEPEDRPRRPRRRRVRRRSSSSSRTGTTTPAIRTGSTPVALERLRAAGLLREAEYEALAEGYEFLRRVELRLRIVHDFAIDHLPERGPRSKQLARRLGYYGPRPAIASSRTTRGSPPRCAGRSRRWSDRSPPAAPRGSWTTMAGPYGPRRPIAVLRRTLDSPALASARSRRPRSRSSAPW